MIDPTSVWQEYFRSKKKSQSISSALRLFMYMH